MTVLIRFENIVKTYGDQVILKGIDLDIMENEFVIMVHQVVEKQRCYVF